MLLLRPVPSAGASSAAPTSQGSRAGTCPSVREGKGPAVLALLQCCGQGEGAAPSSCQGAEVLGPEDGVGGWNRKHCSFTDPGSLFQQPLPSSAPRGLCKEEKVKHINQAVWLFSPFFIIITTSSSSVGFSFVLSPLKCFSFEGGCCSFKYL